MEKPFLSSSSLRAAQTSQLDVMESDHVQEVLLMQGRTKWLTATILAAYVSADGHDEHTSAYHARQGWTVKNKQSCWCPAVVHLLQSNQSCLQHLCDGTSALHVTKGCTVKQSDPIAAQLLFIPCRATKFVFSILVTPHSMS